VFVHFSSPPWVVNAPPSTSSLFKFH
jgi:hypothetical protein